MATSIFLARLIGPFALALGLALVVHGAGFRVLANEFLASPALVFLSGIVTLPEALAARVLVVYHLAEKRPMMAAFLDALGLAHENGLIQEDNVKPDVSKFATAVSAIRQSFPAEDVTLYLNRLVCQDPETWGALSQTLDPQ